MRNNALGYQHPSTLTLLPLQPNINATVLSSDCAVVADTWSALEDLPHEQLRRRM